MRKRARVSEVRVIFAAGAGGAGNADSHDGKSLFFAKPEDAGEETGAEFAGRPVDSTSTRISSSHPSSSRQRPSLFDVGGRLGAYHLVAELGRGPSGVVFRARRADTGYEVALKVVHPLLTAIPGFVDELVAGLRAAAELHHLNIAPIHEVGEADGHYYVVSDLPNGRTLADLLHQEGLPDPERAVRIAIQAAVALDYAHARGVVHGAVKGSNILVGWDDRASVVDFAISGLVEASARSRGRDAPPRRGKGGTPGAFDGDAESKAADRFAFAALLFELLAGAPPFFTAAPAGGTAGWATQALPSVHRLRPELPLALDAVFARALAPDPEARYGSCALLVQAVAGVLKREPQPGLPAPTAPASGKSTPRRAPSQAPDPAKRAPSVARLLVPVAGALVLTLVAAFGLSEFDRAWTGWLGQAAPQATATSPATAGEPTATPAVAAQLAPTPPNPVASPTTLPTPVATAPPTPVAAAAVASEPTGSLVVVRPIDGGASGLYTVAPDGKGLARLPGIPEGWKWAPAVSPDGQWLAMSTGNPDKGDIAVARVDGSAYRLVTRGGDYALSSPWWLPDGRVAFTATAGTHSEIYASGLQGGEALRITLTEPGIGETRNPTAPKTGADFAFSGRLGNMLRIFVQTQSGQPRAISPEKGDAYTPAWSPDGSRIAFSASLVDFRNGIFTMSPDGGRLSQVVQPEPGTWSCCPAWSPDGKWLAYIGDLGKGQSANHGNLYVVPAIGGKPRAVLADGATYYWRPCWLP